MYFISTVILEKSQTIITVTFIKTRIEIIIK